MLDTLKLISWNVRGLTEASRAERVKSWVRRKHKDAMAICLQEVKNSEERLESQLTSIIPGATVVVDLNSEARGGTAIVLTPGVQILNTGTKGDGSCAWATIMTARGPTTIYSVYAPGEPEVRKTTYFKLDYRILDSETVFREAKRTWNDHPREEVDPRVKWILAWRRLKGLFKRVQREQGEKYRELEKKEAELQTLKTMADFDHSEELASEIEILEAEVRSKETWEVTQWRNRSRNRWLKEGEAPSKYFFSQLKTKHQRESIKALQRESGEMITSERGIIGEIEQFYSELYLKDDRVERNIAARDNLLAYVNTTVSPQQNDELIGEPSMEELEEVVKRLPSEKAPGLDGATAEILVRCWAFMKDDCLAMLVNYWQDGVLAMWKGEVVLHLGFPGGDSIREAQICKYLQDKITARTSSWANRWLSWGGRIILVQKILPMLPAYVLMTMGLSKRSYQEMERMWRTFIWGTREDGKAKKSSVAWDIMQQKKEQGGMQILDLGTHSDAVKIRQVAYILNGGQSAWTDIARAFTLKELATGRQRTERRRWTVEEALILGPRLIMKESPTFKQLLHPWYKVRDSLTFVARHGQLPASLTIGQVLTIATKKSGVHLQNEIQLRKFLKSARVDTLADLHPNQTPWQRLQTVILRAEATTALGQDIARLLEWIGQVEITQIPLQQCAGWTWSVRSSNTNRVGWVHETKWWKSILHGVTASAMKLNTKWSVGLDEQSWKQVWTTVWKKPSTTREGFWWWRTLWKGFWNGEQVLKIGVSDGICPRCRAGIESVDHLFWSCSRSKNRWDLLKRVTVSTRNDMRHVNEWFDFKILALRLKNTDATLWAIAAELYRVLWRERNDLVFRGKRSIKPLREVVHETSRSVSAWITKSMPDRHKTLAVNTLETLLHLEIRLEPQAHPPNLVSTLHDSHEDLLQVNIDTQTWRPGELSL
ncbi:hypothetical protein R1sor_002109 [Riccia sorocarpa]|uniref:Reverse transcriptase zinc-binding domain-containing protein n=1 Tax=Riccia sorocarpa TaxID=122646 RepID=A0ABD3H0F8_9MARC